MPGGYIYKKVVPAPVGFGAKNVRDLYSVSDCISEDFTDWVEHWKHNGYWLFDRPEPMRAIARDEGVSLDDMTLLFFRVHPNQWDALRAEWEPFAPDPALETEVEEPARGDLLGFDVVTYSAGTSAECSPLSCNGLAAELPVNEHCLFGSFDEAKEALEAGRFEGCEPGPYRILEVSSIAG